MRVYKCRDKERGTTMTNEQVNAEIEKIIAMSDEELGNKILDGLFTNEDCEVDPDWLEAKEIMERY